MGAVIGREVERAAHDGQILGFALPEGLMSLTMNVSAVVPSLSHNWRPWVPSSAVKNNRPSKAVRFSGFELPLPD